MQNINQNPTYRANRKYYGHDLSQHLEFTSSVGQLLPVYYDIINPGEKIFAKTLLKSRTQPLAANTMTKLEEHLEWYFVPITQIYKPFGNWYYGVQDFGSDFYQSYTQNDTPPMGVRFPYIRANDLRGFWETYNGENYRTLKNEIFYPAFVRLASHLGIADHAILDGIDGMDDAYWSFTPLLFCAYQKIFMDFYRDSNRIENDPRCYNIDSMFINSGSIAQESGYDVMKKMFELRYRPLRKDFYNNVFPSPLFGNGVVGSQLFEQDDLYEGTLTQVNQWLTNLHRVSVNDPDGRPYDSVPTNVALGPNQGTGGNMDTWQLNRANIESLFAVDKLLEVTRRAGKHYDAQTLAHFGVQVPDSIEGQAIFLGRHTQSMIIGDVISTADTSSGDPLDPSSFTGAPLGEVGGKGYSGENSKPISFKAPCHGVLMCIYSATPAQDYYD